MAGKLVQIITSPDLAVRHQSLDAHCRAATLRELLAECEELENFRRTSESLYFRASERMVEILGVAKFWNSSM